MKTFLLHVKRITAGTHSPSEQLGLPLHKAEGYQFTRHNMLMQDTVYRDVYHGIYTYVMLYTSISHDVPEVLGVLVQDELSGRESFSLFLVHDSMSGMSYCCIALLQAQEVLQGSGAVPQSHCAPGPPGHQKTCLLPLPCQLHQAC
jgi:hypothetical protein